MSSTAIPLNDGPARSEESFILPQASYPKASTAQVPEVPEEIRRLASKAIEDLNSIFDSKQYSSLDTLFLSSGSFWRDHLGLSPTKFSTLAGATEIVNFLHENSAACTIQKFALERSKQPEIGKVDPAGTIKTIQAYVTFETENAFGRGIINWIQDVDDGDQWKIFTVYTALDDLKNSPFATGFNRPMFANPNDVDDIENWKDFREATVEFKDVEPTVLIVGRDNRLPRRKEK
jgi:hypothetical protein